MENRNLRTVFGIIIIAVFLALVYFLPQLITITNPDTCMVNGECAHEARLNLVEGILPFLLLAAFVFGAVAMFVLYRPAERKPSERASANDILSLLEPDERKVVEKISREGGKAMQSELSRIEGLGKVRAHRIVARLVKRGVVEKESSGKTNIVRLSKGITGILVDK